MKRRQRFLNPFGLAFLDVMSCGLGAAVLLFLIIDHNLTEKAQASESGEAEAQALEQSIEEQEDLATQHRRQTQQLQRELKRLAEQRVAALMALAQTDARQTQAVDTGELEREVRNRQKQLQQAKKSRQVRDTAGDGQRQYVAGFKMTGKRILILLDRSASMQDEKVATVIYKQFLPVQTQRASFKWRWARSIFEWMLAGLPRDSQFQVWGFSSSHAVVPSPGWIPAQDQKRMEAVIEAVRQWVPKGGTRLDQMLAQVSRLNPRPDAVYLITDGLPTQGSSLFKRAKVSAEQRLEFFNEATASIRRPTFHVVLLPLEGDPMAPGAYWQFAMRTGGQFLAPSEEWP